jgi:Xaa-Pro aminopeptidase
MTRATSPGPAPPATPGTELSAKLAIVREALDRHRLGAARLRGHDWFAWATCGGSNAVLLASERGVAEVLVTPSGAWVVTDEIEEERLRDEELPAGLEVVAFRWARPADRDVLVSDAAGGDPVASDLPGAAEEPLPAELAAARRRLRPEEIDRYRRLGRDAAQALTETLEQARPSATEFEVAGSAANALLRRGIDPALVLVAGADRAERYRHPRPTTAPIGDRVSVVACARRSGLYANLTRHAFLRPPTAAERGAANTVAAVEAAAWEASRPGTTLGEVYEAIADAYARAGHPGAERGHHQGGTTGYLSREAIAMPGSKVRIETPLALAWNPSLPGAKIEDTVVRSDDGLEILTVDPVWPTSDVAGRPRPDLRVLA